jgi:hypothetical protein
MTTHPGRTDQRDLSTVKRDCQHPRARHQHGTQRAYDADLCRCMPCRLASHDAESRYWRTGTSADPESWMPRAGTVRRLQALRAIGYSDLELGAFLGASRQAVRSLRHSESPRIMASTAWRVAAMFEALSAHPKAGTSATRARMDAARRGWLPPLAWDDESIDDPAAAPAVASARRRVFDEVAVLRAVAGDPPARMSKQERAEAVRRLNAQELSAAEIGLRLGRSTRGVVRARARERAA